MLAAARASLDRLRADLPPPVPTRYVSLSATTNATIGWALARDPEVLFVVWPTTNQPPPYKLLSAHPRPPLSLHPCETLVWAWCTTARPAQTVLL